MEKTLIFLHGGPGFEEYLEDYFIELKTTFKCIFYNQLRGGDVTIEKLLNQLDEIVDQQEGSVILVGHSWGGVLATSYVIKYQRKISGLVLMSTGLSSVHWYDEYYKELDDLGLADGTMEDIFLTEDELTLGKPLLEFGEKTFSEKTFESLEPYLKTYNLTMAFRDINIPILNIYGEFDARFPKRIGKEIANLNANVTSCEVVGAGHFPFLKEVGKQQISKNFKLWCKSIKGSTVEAK